MGAVTSDNPLGDYLGVLWRRKVILLPAVAVVTTTAFLLSNRQQKMYSSSAQVLLTSNSADDSTVETQRRVFERAAVNQEAAKQLPGALKASAGRVAGSRIITATVQNPDPQLAADSS